MRTANRRKSDYVALALCELFGFCWKYLYFSIQCTSMKIVIWVVWLGLQIKCGWACLECWYWECLLLRCKCICIIKPCLCRECKSFYSLVPIKNACWRNLSAFTFSASLPVNDCLWITFCACTHFSFWAPCMSRKKMKRKKFPMNGLRTEKSKTEPKKKKFQWNSSL